MHYWVKRLFALAAPLLLTACLWGPGKFTSDLSLKKDGTFILDYRGEMVLQLGPDKPILPSWKPEMARCYVDGRTRIVLFPKGVPDLKVFDPKTGQSPTEKTRPCTPSETAKLKARHEADQAQLAASQRKENEGMAKVFGLPGLDDESNR